MTVSSLNVSCMLLSIQLHGKFLDNGDSKNFILGYYTKHIDSVRISSCQLTVSEISFEVGMSVARILLRNAFSELLSLRVWGDDYTRASCCCEGQIKIIKSARLSSQSKWKIFSYFQWLQSFQVFIQQVFTPLKKASENLQNWSFYIFKQREF